MADSEFLNLGEPSTVSWIDNTGSPGIVLEDKDNTGPVIADSFAAGSSYLVVSQITTISHKII